MKTGGEIHMAHRSMLSQVSWIWRLTPSWRYIWDKGGCAGSGRRSKGKDEREKKKKEKRKKKKETGKNKVCSNIYINHTSQQFDFVYSDVTLDEFH
jgi:hypothetical protein